MILGNKLKLKLIEDEQREISRAKYLSAPSESAVVASSASLKSQSVFLATPTLLQLQNTSKLKIVSKNI